MEPWNHNTKTREKVCVWCVLNSTLIALVRKNLVIDIAFESGAPGRNHTFLKYYLNIDG